MEFRIAPMIMACFNLLYLLFVNPLINDAVPLNSVANLWKILIPFLIIFLMAMGTYSRHSFYSKSFKWTFYVVQGINVILAMYYVYAIRSQHLS